MRTQTKDPVAERLRAARLSARMSQTDLEIRSGIPKARISRYENGHVIPSIPSLRLLAGAMDVKLGSLLD